MVSDGLALSAELGRLLLSTQYVMDSKKLCKISLSVRHLHLRSVKMIVWWYLDLGVVIFLDEEEFVRILSFQKFTGQSPGFSVCFLTCPLVALVFSRMPASIWLVAWLGSNALVLVTVVTLRQARLVLGWVIIIIIGSSSNMSEWCRVLDFRNSFRCLARWRHLASSKPDKTMHRLVIQCCD